MAFASYGASGPRASETTLCSYLATFLNGGIIAGTDQSYPGFFNTYQSADDQRSLINGDWKVVWGPIVVTRNHKTDTAANAMYVAYSALTQAYVVAIAGTDYASLYDWREEDLKVGPPMCSWPIGSTGSAAMISVATENAMNLLAPMTYDNSTLAQFLASDAVTRDGHTLIFAGHSLAGALAPTLAFDLFPTAEAKAAWSDVFYLGLAGPTAGNTAFATATNTLFPQVETNEAPYSYWNTNYHNINDMVPRAWNDLATLMPAVDEQTSSPVYTIWGYVTSDIAWGIGKLVVALRKILEDLVYSPVNSQIFDPDMGSYIPGGSQPWPPTWQPFSLPTPEAPLDKFRQLGALIEAAHHDEYLYYFGLTPLQPLDVPGIAAANAAGAARLALFVALADLHAAVSAESDGTPAFPSARSGPPVAG